MVSIATVCGSLNLDFWVGPISNSQMKIFLPTYPLPLSTVHSQPFVSKACLQQLHLYITKSFKRPSAPFTGYVLRAPNSHALLIIYALFHIQMREPQKNVILEAQQLNSPQLWLWLDSSFSASHDSSLLSYKRQHFSLK